MELSELPERLPKSTYRIGYFDERETKRQEYEDYTKDLVWGNTMARQPAPPYGDLVNKFLRLIPSSWIVRSYAALAPNGFSFAEPGGKYRIDPVTGKTVCLAKGEERQRAITTVQVFSAHFKASHPKLAVSDTPLTRMASNALSLFGTTHGSIDLVTDVRSEAPGLLRTLARNLPPKLHTTGPRIRAQSGSYRTPKGTASSVLSYDFLVSWL